MYSKILLLGRQWKKSISCHHVSFWLTADSRRQAKVHSLKYGDAPILMSVCVCVHLYVVVALPFYPPVSHPLSLYFVSVCLCHFIVQASVQLCVEIHYVILCICILKHFRSVVLKVEVSHWLTDVRKHSCIENRKYEKRNSNMAI